MSACPFRTGAQSYSFRSFDFEGSIRCLKELGVPYIEYCSVHFPCDAADEGFAHVKQRLHAEGVQTLCFGVEGFGPDAAANRKKFELAKALGIEALSADPTPDSFDNLGKLTEEFGIKIAIHNHGPNARYDKVADTLNAVKGHSPLIGACVDTGHAVRSGEKPHEVIEQLGARVLSLHLKDWKFGGEEQILGEGDMDMVAVARALDALGFNGPVVMEYENSPENPVPEMKIGLDNWFKACGA
ncbi:MAG: sugar phosphate isomerase/epimerase [Candidatus Hydrogenedentes bacterium]|nr:sugar phosphate isomerase/epimerase [Candidatus Hydrogenedentota bacterium]